MMDELEDDLPDMFKGTLQITRDESKNDVLETKTNVHGWKTESNSKGNEVTSSVNRNTNDEHGNDSTSADSPQNTLITNFTQKVTPLVRRFSTNTTGSFNFKRNGNGTVNQTAIALKVETPTNYFTFRDGIMDKAVDDCVADIIAETDGTLVGKYLLTEINIWDSDKERLILLMTKCVISVKYDFIALKILEFRRIMLKDLDNVVVGDLVYPPGSLVPDRKARGVRLMWNRGEPLKFAVKWNPFNDDVPICTLTSHPLFFHSECQDNHRMFFNFDEFLEKLRLIIGRENLNNVTIHHKSIVLQNYVGLGSLIHNRNDFGFFKVRGKFSF